MSAEVLDLKDLIAIAAEGQALTLDQAKTAFEIIMSGNATPSQMGGFLMSLRVRGESIDEITGAVSVMRDKMNRINAPEGAIDIVGTGGDGTGTYNISTASAIVTAAAGVPVAKHGNRAASSQSGAADVFSELGVNIEADFSLVEKALNEVGLCFMMAQRHHGAMRNVGPTRVELGTRTIFNLLGPMSNPAGVKRQLIGCFSKDWIRPMADTLGKLGSEKVWVVHGSDGSDELTNTGISYVAALEYGALREFEIHPEEAGIPVARLDDLKGGTPAENARALRGVLDGVPSAFRNIVLYNVAAALQIADRTANLHEGVEIAKEAIDSGKAKNVIEQLAAITNSDGTAS